MPIGAAEKKGNACRFSIHVTEVFDKKSADSEICNRMLASDPPPYLPFDQPHSIDDEMIRDAGLHRTSAGEAGNVDFDNDGRSEVLAKLHFDDVGGRGCTYEFFDLLNDEGTGFSSSKKRQLLHELQGIDKDERYSVPHCEGNVTGWFRYKGITYYETKYPGNKPKDAGQEFHTVSYIKDGKIHKVCDGCFKKQVKVQ